MGGRRSYSVIRVIGESPKDRKKYKKALKSKDHKKLISTTIEAFTNNKKTLGDFAKAFDFLEFIDKNSKKKYKYYGERKKVSKEFWAKEKRKKEIKIDRLIETILIDSVTKVVFRGDKRKKK